MDEGQKIVCLHTLPMEAHPYISFKKSILFSSPNSPEQTIPQPPSYFHPIVLQTPGFCLMSTLPLNHLLRDRTKLELFPVDKSTMVAFKITSLKENWF